MKILQYFFAILLFHSTLHSCKKKTVVEDNISPIIMVTAPIHNSSVGPGVVTIKGTATDNISLYEVHVHISNYTTGGQLVDYHHTINAPTYNFTETFTAVAGIQYKIQVQASDKALNLTYENVIITCQ